MTRNIVLRRSPIHGTGVFAARDLPRGLNVIQYRGRLLTHAQADRRYAGSSETGHTFLYSLNDDYVIDANVGGNIARWINHGCAPNCEAVLLEDDQGDRTRDRICIEIRRRVRKGEELTYDYGITLDEPHTARMKRIWSCRCGARRCSGTMLQPKPRGKKKTSS